ncbi:Glutamate decarboxylase-like protein [Cladobotryum mycophilum]|uniref:Glutamate decarboxylase-like protein n=1 Tax=Cladobotryum mycophilum TaxID=491253 RepID=A0ABR0SX93_9HYPO
MAPHLVVHKEQSRGQELMRLLKCVESTTVSLVHEADQTVPVTKRLNLPNNEPPKPLSSPNSIGHLQSLEQLQAGICKPLPADGLGEEGFYQAISFLSRHSVNTSSFGFMDKLYSAPSPPGIAADLFLSILNNNSHVWHVSPALSTVEKHVASQLARLFGIGGENVGGITVPGGAAGNMLAMLVARNILAPEIKKHGCLERQRYAIFTSEASHYSIANAAQILGLGSNAVITIPTTSNGSMDIDSLELAVDQALGSGMKPLFIAATAGTTVRGAFDPLEEVGRIAKKVNAWYHVDGCWGGAAVFSDELRNRLAGAELADSISFNPHKLLGVPLVCSFLLAKDLRTFWLANKLEAGYLFHDTKTQGESSGTASAASIEAPIMIPSTSPLELGTPSRRDWRKSEALENAPPASKILDLASLTTQCGRRPDASKFYLHWIYYGIKGMASDVEKAVTSARYLASLVDRSPYLTLVGDVHVPFAQVCFYWKAKSAFKGTLQDRAVINSRTTHQLSSHLVTRGWMIDYAPGTNTDGQEGDFLRVVCNRLTDEDVVEALLGEIIRVGIELDL